MKTIFTYAKRQTYKSLILTGLLLSILTNSFAQTKHLVEVSNNKFTPSELEIAVGDTIEWNNVQGFHNVNGTQDAYPSNPESFGNSTGSGWTYSHVFNNTGDYDYHCDPHVSLGMTGKIRVRSQEDNNKHNLTISFNQMTPHVSQKLWLSVIEKDSGKEIERKMEDISEQFTVSISGIETDHSYFINFFADHNGNGSYDAPPVDHAWQLELDNVIGDTTLTFSHNTNFTDIMWKNRLTVNFSGMNPHVGQNLWLAVIDKNSGMELDRVKTTVEESFMVHVYGIENGMSYNVDFFADHNGNGSYDAPSDDHAWRLDLDNVAGDTTLNFSHNTNFTDIMWKNLLTVNFSGMNPHVGQNLWLAVIDKNSGMELDRVKTTVEESFMVHVYGIENGMSYNVDFFADHNGNGSYDAPSDDHAWRLDLDNVAGDTTLNFSHNTNFTDIMWKNRLTVNFSGMNPHVGQNLWLAVIDKNSGMELDRVKTTVEESFMVHVYGIENGMSYNVDFFADHNGNGSYDAPSDDHAWRLDLDNVAGDTTLNFSHNTNFTDIMWKNLLTVNFSGMNPHVGQNLWLAVIDKNSGMELDRVKTTVEESFMVHVYGIENGMSYNVDFFADHNGNGSYDAPLDDHAWRLDLDNVAGDTTLNFSHNTNFTDIMWKHELKVHFTGMTPHIGQMLELYVVDSDDGLTKDTITIDEITGAEFNIQSMSLIKGHSYKINFFADFNMNGNYDAPPTDHAWQLDLENAIGDTTLNFSHNTNFIDIFNTTSISENNLSQIKMYPNPAKNRVSIESGDFQFQDVTLSVYNISGSLSQIEYFKISNKIELNVQNLKSGMYFIELQTQGQKKVLNLIKK